METSIESPSTTSSTPATSPTPLQTSSSLSPASSSLNVSLFNGSGNVNGIESFSSSANGEELTVEPLEKNPSDGKDENCKHCQ